MRGEQSQLVREVAIEQFVKPARQSGANEVVIPVIKLRDFLVPRGFPPSNIPQICSALEAKEFRREFEEMSVEGPASKRSTTVVFHFFFRKPPAAAEHASGASPADEDPAARAKRVVDGLCGLLRDEITSYGGAEAFMRWVRSEEDDAA
jgi:hypothetical protein